MILTGILLPSTLSQTVASGSNHNALKGITVSTSEKLPKAPRPYQGVKVSKQDIQEMVSEQFTLYGIASQIPTALKVVQCESGFNINADNGISYGVAQFTPATWKDFGHGNIFNPLYQIETMAKMWKIGLQKRWDCYRMIAP